MKNQVTPTSYELVNQKRNIAETFNLLLDQCCEFLKNFVVAIYESSFVQTTIRVIQLTSVLATTLYLLNLIALIANGFAATFGGSPSLSMAVQYELFTAGLWFVPFTALLSVLFLRKNFSNETEK